MMKNGAPTLISDPTIISIFGEFTPLRILTFQKFSPPTVISDPTLILFLENSPPYFNSILHYGSMVFEIMGKIVLAGNSNWEVEVLGKLPS